MEFHHIGIATRDIDATAKYYQLFGYRAGNKIVDPIQRVVISFLVHDKMPLLELVSPQSQDSPVARTLEKTGTTPYHTCFVVQNIQNEIDRLKRERFIVVVKPVQAVAFQNRLIAFLYNPHAGLIELLQGENV